MRTSGLARLLTPPWKRMRAYVTRDYGRSWRRLIVWNWERPPREMEFGFDGGALGVDGAVVLTWSEARFDEHGWEDTSRGCLDVRVLPGVYVTRDYCISPLFVRSRTIVGWSCEESSGVLARSDDRGVTWSKMGWARIPEGWRYHEGALVDGLRGAILATDAQIWCVDRPDPKVRLGWIDLESEELAWLDPISLPVGEGRPQLALRRC